MFRYTIHFKMIFTNGMIEGSEPFPYKWISHFYYTICQEKIVSQLNYIGAFFYSCCLIKFWEGVVLGQTQASTLPLSSFPSLIVSPLTLYLMPYVCILLGTCSNVANYSIIIHKCLGYYSIQFRFSYSVWNELTSFCKKKMWVINTSDVHILISVMPPCYTHFLLIMVSFGNSFRFSRHEIMHYEKNVLGQRDGSVCKNTCSG